MNRRYTSLAVSVLYFLCFTSIAFMLLGAFNVLHFSHTVKILLSTAVVVSGYFSAFFSALGRNDRQLRCKIMKCRIALLFAFYIALMIDFTLIDDNLGRNIFGIFGWSREGFSAYVNESTNLIPFKTVKLFLNAYRDKSLPVWNVVENILGNFVAFMPLPFFLKCLFKWEQHRYAVLLTVLLSVISIELLQLLLLTGASDIDDVILNTAGAMLLYAVLKIPAVNCFLCRFTLGAFGEDIQ